MSTDTNWSSPSRVVVILGIGLLVLGAWYGGRMSAGGGGPFGMMDGPMHHRASGESMMSGPGGTSSGDPAGHSAAGADFSGEAGLQRCRAVMSTMTGGHRSMQSMMDGENPGRGAMHGPMHDSMHGRMGASGDAMGPDQMRSLCRTMQEAMHAAMTGDSTASADRRRNAVEESGLSSATRQWLQGTRGFEAVRDRTGEDEVVVEVGAGDGFQYAPAAVRVDPGTTVRWRWTGRGGLHDVAFLNEDVSTSLRDEAGAEFTTTFDEPGTYRYECTPHAGLGMRGAVIVSGDA